MNKLQTIVFIIIAGVGSLYVLTIFGDGINLNFIPENTTPPPLSDLFPERPNGPHQKFVSEEACLSCHQNSITIPSVGTTPKIAHEFRKNCTSCHLLPGVQI
jgi:hypothetical protein